MSPPSPTRAEPDGPRDAPPTGARAWLADRVRDLRHLHRAFADDRAGPPPLAARELVVLLVSALLIVLYFYYGKAGFYRDVYLPDVPLDRPHRALYPYVYWALSSLVLRTLIPMLCIWILLRERVRDYGFSMRGVVRHAPLYLALYLCMLPVLYLASLQPAFQAKYPFYAAAANGGVDLLVYELCYGTQFFALESFFRGFLIFGLFKRFGHYALLIAAIPYCLIHFGKPVSETLGAIAAGLILGHLALRTGSFFLGFVLHWGIGLTMDLMAIAQRAS